MENPNSVVLEKIKKYSYRVLGEEVSTLTRHFKKVINFAPENSQGTSQFIEAKDTIYLQSNEIHKIKDFTGPKVVFLDGNINHTSDIQELLESIKTGLERESRVVAVLYNSYFKIFFLLMNGLGLRKGEIPTTFINRTSLRMLSHLSGFEITRIQPVLYFPFYWFGFGQIINWVMRLIPGLKWLSFNVVVCLRPAFEEKSHPSLSIVVPARNEAGNIKQICKRLKNLEHLSVEVIFVEGHSKDATWDAIESELKNYQGPFKLKGIRQSGKGKKNAVAEGFQIAMGDLLTILDADMTMPPEKLILFYEAYRHGKGDFINGSRLIYPLQTGAMQLLNQLGNVFFAWALSYVTDTPLTDSLCGTKLVSRKQYEMQCSWNQSFGDFDPFGDFELIFSAAALGLGLVDVPIKYEARTYGSTNISRFTHGFQLLRMTLIGLVTLKLGRSYKKGPTRF